MRRLVILSCAAALAACSTHPKPPTVSGYHRTPINSEAAKAELQLMVYPPAPASTPVKVQAIAPARPLSQTISVGFPWNGSAFRPTSSQSAQLRAVLAHGVDRIEVRGRTDNPRPTNGDERVARARAEAARDWLIGQGIPAGKISVNYVSAGDYASNNRVSSGRALNRRVDIEIIRK